MDRCGGVCLSAHASLPQSHPRGAVLPEAVKVEEQAQTVMPSVKKQTLTRCGTSRRGPYSILIRPGPYWGSCRALLHCRRRTA